MANDRKEIKQSNNEKNIEMGPMGKIIDLEFRDLLDHAYSIFEFRIENEERIRLIYGGVKKSCWNWMLEIINKMKQGSLSADDKAYLEGTKEPPFANNSYHKKFLNSEREEVNSQNKVTCFNIIALFEKYKQLESASKSKEEKKAEMKKS